MKENKGRTLMPSSLRQFPFSLKLSASSWSDCCSEHIGSEKRERLICKDVVSRKSSVTSLNVKAPGDTEKPENSVERDAHLSTWLAHSAFTHGVVQRVVDRDERSGAASKQGDSCTRRWIILPLTCDLSWLLLMLHIFVWRDEAGVNPRMSEDKVMTTHCFRFYSPTA